MLVAIADKRAMDKLMEEGDGVIELQSFIQEELPLLRIGYVAHDPEARLWLERIITLMHEVQKPSLGKRPVCLACDVPQSQVDKLSFAFATAYSPVASCSISAVVCRGCANTNEAVSKAWYSFIMTCFPDSKPFKVTHPEGGRA